MRKRFWVAKRDDGKDEEGPFTQAEAEACAEAQHGYVTSERPKAKPKFRVCIRWGGSEEARKQGRCDYRFATEAELDAFLYGVDEAQGWLDYKIVRIVPKDKLEESR